MGGSAELSRQCRHIDREGGGHDSSQFVSVTLLEVTWRAKEKGGTLEMGRDHWVGTGGQGCSGEAGLSAGCRFGVGVGGGDNEQFLVALCFFMVCVVS